MKDLLITLTLALIALTISCAGTNSDNNVAAASSPAAQNVDLGSHMTKGSPTPEPTEQPMPPTVFTPADVAKLKWIEGTCKGTGEGMEPFYERYSFRDPNTLAVESFDDESLTKPGETTLFVLKDGHFGNSGDSRWAANEITGDSINFVPIFAVKNTFKWKRDDENSWTATLTWPSGGDKPEKVKVYKMTRIGKK